MNELCSSFMFDAIYNWAVLQLFAGINELVVMMLI
jgi:hypothetical protein